MSAIDDLIRSAAVACAHGNQQRSFVNELLAGPVHAHWVLIPVYGGTQVLKFGKTRLSGSSMKNLKARLTYAGFILEKDPLPRKGEYLLIMRHRSQHAPSI